LWTVEGARPEDAGQILEVQRRAFGPVQKHYTVALPPLREEEADVRAAIARGGVLVAREGGRVVGAARVRVEDRRAEVSHVAVLPEYAHLAVGRSLMAAAEEEAVRRGAVEVDLEVGLRDAAAIDFYLKLGYRPYVLVPDDVNGYDTLRFRRRLAPASG
jgi:ribosomal protein S18 acetylase RimI-like enzyme